MDIDFAYSVGVPAYFPIIYVRGYAFSQKEIEETTDDPTNGFNIGSTHARQGYRSMPIRYHFPGPFVRLMTTHRYSDTMRQIGDSVQGVADLRKTLWIHRFYDPYSKTFADGGKDGRPSIFDSAKELGKLIGRVREICFSDKDNDEDRKVILIAHSMGGLICRSFMQKVIEDDAGKVIEKVVTYGTPHGGIPLSFKWIRKNGLNNFSPHDLFEALAPKGVAEKGFNPQELYHFDPERFLCVIGTNDVDYEVGGGIVSAVAGFGTDGLVPVDNAYVDKAPTAYVHRSHSGRYGLVSSAEAFAAVERFLFGGLRVVVRLDPPGPPPDDFDFRPIKPTNKGTYSVRVGLMDVEGRVGQLGQRVNDRNADHMSAVVLGEEPERIATFHFLKRDINKDDRTYKFSLTLRLRRDTYNSGSLADSRTAMMQDLQVWMSELEKKLVLRYQWLGGEEEDAAVVENRAVIKVPESGYHSSPKQPMTLKLEFSGVEGDTFNPGSGLDFGSNEGGSGPAAEPVVTDERLKEMETEDAAVAGYGELVGAGSA